MRSITYKGKSVEVPTHISELTPKQYEYYCFLAYAIGTDTISGEYFRIRWLSYLLGMEHSDYTILLPEYIAEIEAQSDCINGFFIESDNKQGFTLSFSTPQNLLPTYGDYTGPGDWLEGVTYGEFVECITILEGLAEADAQEVADGYDNIARILYHIPSNEEVPSILAFHAPTLFASVWKEIQTGPIEINGKKIDFRIIFKGDGQSRPDDKTGWTGITFEVASAGLFGQVREVEKTDMWAVLIYLYRCKFEYNAEMRRQKS